MNLSVIQQMVNAEVIGMVETALLNLIVSGQSEDNLKIIADVYQDITNLVESGNITVTENVRIAMRRQHYDDLLSVLV